MGCRGLRCSSLGWGPPDAAESCISTDTEDNHAPEQHVIDGQRRIKMTHLLIATPTAGGIVKSLYATTLIKNVLAIKEAGWGVDFATVDGSYITRARNFFAN